MGILGGSGNDTFNITPTTENLNNIQGALTVWGDGGTNTLNIDDQHNTAVSTYSVTSSTISRAGAAAISYASENVNLHGGSGNDTYNIAGTPTGTTLAVQGGAGNDTFNVSPTAKNLGNILGNLSINGGGGNNVLVLNDQTNSANSSYALTPTTVSRAGMATVTYGALREPDTPWRQWQ